VFAATVGGIRVTEPAADLAMALAVASGGLNLAISPRLAAIGEVGLTGEVRRVGAVPRRLAEAARLGFRYALVPPDCGPSKTGVGAPGLRVQEVADLSSALQWAARLSAE
jgi:DNA repair protein RadA/Sms